MHVVSNEKINCGHSATSLYHHEWFVFSLGACVDAKLHRKGKDSQNKGSQYPSSTRVYSPIRVFNETKITWQYLSAYDFLYFIHPYAWG